MTDEQELHDEVNIDERVIIELRKQGFTPIQLIEAKRLLTTPKLKQIIKIDEIKIDKATEILKQIEILSTEIAGLRFSCNHAAKILGKDCLFYDNGELANISTKLVTYPVHDDDSLHIFIDMMHKLIIASQNLGEINKITEVEKALLIVNRYRQSFDHILDMRGGGKGSASAYQELGRINQELLGHKVLKADEYPTLQIKILSIVRDTLRLIRDNAEDWIINKRGNS